MTLTHKELDALLTAGSMAPSGGNIQPWKVTVKNNNTFLLSLDAQRSNTFLDVGHFASYLSLGSFAENMIITGDHLGLQHTLTYLPSKKYTDPFVEIHFSRSKNHIKSDLYTAIGKRVTNRHMHEGDRIPQRLVEQLQHEVVKHSSQAMLHVIHTEKDKKSLADILGIADGVRTFHPELFQQMLDEMRWNASETKKTQDGIDIETLELPAMMKQLLLVMKNHPHITNVFPRKAFENQAKPLLMASSHLCCLSMSSKPTPRAMFEIGRTLEYLWLHVTNKNLAMHPWTVLTFFLIRVYSCSGDGFSKEDIATLKSLNQQMRALFGLPKDAIPVFIFRLSVAKSPSTRSLRLPWKAFTSIE